MPLPLAALIPLVTAAFQGGSQILGSVLNRRQSLKDIEAQNKYNSPVEQLARLREAGLPFAAYSQGQAGNQSATPQTSGEGVKSAGNTLANHIIYSTQLKQLDILKQDERLKKAEVRKTEAETDWLLSNAGEDRANTNLTRSLKTRQSLEVANEKGQRLLNKINEIEIRNKPYRQSLENAKLTAEVGSILQNYGLTDQHIKGAELDNKIKNVVADYQPGMSQKQFEKLLKENDLLDVTIEGKKTDNAISAIRQRVDAFAEDADKQGRYMDMMLKELTWERVKEEFTNYKQYQEFVQRVQDHLNKTPWEQIKDPAETFKAIAAQVYTSVTGLTGQSSGLLNFIK